MSTVRVPRRPGAAVRQASWQRWLVHFVRNALALVPQPAAQWMAAGFRSLRRSLSDREESPKPTHTET
ncbi:MAG: transposase, partial [Ktedonobacterales bacterium]